MTWPKKRTPTSIANRQVILEEHAAHVEADVQAFAHTLKYISMKIQTCKDMPLVPECA